MTKLVIFSILVDVSENFVIVEHKNFVRIECFVLLLLIKSSDMHHQVEICRSCGSQISENYCGNCGQKRFQRINRNYILEEFRSIYVASNKGFFYTLKNLLINPGRTAREFINGDRQKHYKPILLALLLATLSAFISFQIMGVDDVMDALGPEYRNNTFFNDYMVLLQNYYSLIMIGLIPVYSLASWLAFKKWGDNYYEHIVANAFFQALYTLLTMLLYPVFKFFPNNGETFMILSTIIFIVAFPLYIWFMRGFYAQKSFGAVIMKVLVTFLLISLFSVFILFGFSFLVAIYLGLFRPELLESMAPPQ